MNHSVFGIAFLIIPLLILPFICSCSDDIESKIGDPLLQLNVYGLDTDSLSHFEGIVQRNETFADILRPHNISYTEIYNLVEFSKSKFDVKKIKAGNNYHIYSTADSLNKILDFF